MPTEGKERKIKIRPVFLLVFLFLTHINKLFFKMLKKINLAEQKERFFL